jgi:site-specific DNA-methyltransferase (adenine-specific)
MTIRIEHADMLEAIPRLVVEGVACDAIVTDPPYHLTATQKRFGAVDAAPAQHGRDGAMVRLSGGFMGQQWDGGDIAFRPETWATVATILRPGAFLVAFGGTRTYHRLACAIEDGGFVIQDCIMWLFATGFPKRRDMLKPAYEPLVLAYKPGGKRMMQIDECRIGVSRGVPASLSKDKTPNGNAPFSRMVGVNADLDPNVGRWPANICHDGSDEVLVAFPDSAASVAAKRNGKDDGGSAARFFFSAKAGRQDRWGSRHPTVKPVELMKWLAALVCPPGGLLLDPFAGSGTTGVAALATGRNAILIEREDAYVADIRERMAHYKGEGRHSVVAKNRHQPEGIGALRDGGRTAAVSQERAKLPLFEHRPFDEAIDSKESYDLAVQAIGERVKAGAPVPDFFLSDKGL